MYIIIHIHHFNSYFPGEPGLVSFPSIIRGVEASFLQVEWPSSYPTNSVKCTEGHG